MLIVRGIFVDQEGRVFAPSIGCDSESGGNVIMTAVQGISSANLTALQFTTTRPGLWDAQSPRTYDARTLAMLQLTNSLYGGHSAFAVPAPLASIFYSDTETVDPSAISFLRAQLGAHGLAPSGVALDVYVAGLRRRAPNHNL